MNSNENTFGKRFKKLRNEMGLTQKELVKLFNKKYYYNFNTSSISMYENEKQIPEIDVLNKWADFFNVSLDYLVGRTDVRNQSEKIFNEHKEADEFLKRLKEEMIKEGIDFDETSAEELIETYKILKQFKEKTKSN